MNGYFNYLKLIVLCYCLVSIAWANIPVKKNKPLFFSLTKGVRDTIGKADSIVYYNIDPTKRYLGKDSLAISRIDKWTKISLTQYLKGEVAGVYSQEISSEPGTIQQLSFIRGLSFPLLGPYDLAKNKPLIVLDGIPLLDDPSIVYDVQDYSIQPIGAATTLQSIFDLGNIASIQVLKDYSTAGIYGPQAAQGVIYITTKQAKPGNRRISISTYGGFAAPSPVTTMNANYEKNFRRPFYQQYASPQQAANYPAYLSDSSYVNFYGPSNWTDLYYKETPLFSVNASLSGGGTRSNFRAFAGAVKNQSGVDETSLSRYQTAFYINMQPNKWMTISSMLHMTRLDRDRNRSLHERFGETNFIPDLSTPLAPNKEMYGLYLKEYEQSLDNNINNSMVGKIVVNLQLAENLNYSPRFSIDYNENKRDVFWPSTLLAGNNYISNYFGYNERLNFDNLLNYRYHLNARSSLLAELGFNYQADTHKYNYIKGYKGPNDFIKVNIVEGDSKKADYLRAIGFIPYYYADQLQQRLLSFYGRFTYAKESSYKLAALFRRDGSSSMQADNRWFNAFNVDGEYNLNQHFQLKALRELRVSASYGRMGIVPDNDKLMNGPYYTADLGWEGFRSMSSFNGMGVIHRPYQSGWVGYGIPWAYHNLLNVALAVDFKKAIGLRFEYYDRHTKNAMINIPTVAESGYRYELKPGMAVQNRGLELTFDAQLLEKRKTNVGWNIAFNVAYNTNKLTALPQGLEEIVIGSKKLRVGQRIDHFWLLRNEGIYLNDADVPVDPVQQAKMRYNNGTSFTAGDPRWSDLNQDYNIDNQDRELRGNSIPKYIGGLFNQFTYRGFDLSFQLYFNLGRNILHEKAAKFYDFVNTDESVKMNAVRDITFWEKSIDEQKYPLYNPWSAVSPYQVEQDLFLESGSFLKLRSLSLGYDLASFANKRKKIFDKLYVYVSGSNLFTVTSYSGRDPELADFNGYDYGYGLRFSRTFTLGLKLDF